MYNNPYLIQPFYKTFINKFLKDKWVICDIMSCILFGVLILL